MPNEIEDFEEQLAVESSKKDTTDTGYRGGYSPNTDRSDSDESDSESVEGEKESEEPDSERESKGKGKGKGKESEEESEGEEEESEEETDSESKGKGKGKGKGNGKESEEESEGEEEESEEETDSESKGKGKGKGKGKRKGKESESEEESEEEESEETDSESKGKGKGKGKGKRKGKESESEEESEEEEEESDKPEKQRAVTPKSRFKVGDLVRIKSTGEEKKIKFILPDGKIQLYKSGGVVTKINPSRLPSTDPSVWNARYNIGDKVKIRIDFTAPNRDTDKIYTISGYEEVLGKYDPDPLKKGGFQRPENPSGRLYYLTDNGGNWEGKDLEPVLLQPKVEETPKEIFYEEDELELIEEIVKYVKANLFEFLETIYDIQYEDIKSEENEIVKRIKSFGIEYPNWFTPSIFPESIHKPFYLLSENLALVEGIDGLVYSKDLYEQHQFTAEELQAVNDKILKYFVLKIKNSPNWFKPKGWEYYFNDVMGDYMKSLLTNNVNVVYTDSPSIFITPISENKLMVLATSEAEQNGVYGLGSFIVEIHLEELKILSKKINYIIDTMEIIKNRIQNNELKRFDARAEASGRTSDGGFDTFGTILNLYVSKIMELAAEK